jgi:hypothetical protein
VRARIIDAAGTEVLPGIIAATPEVSRPMIGREGLAELVNDRVRITLDGGGVIWGHECWWEPIR